jgi:hypothetical protein
MTTFRDELEGKTICLDMTPQEAMQEHHIASKEGSEQMQGRNKTFSNMAYPIVDVRSFHAALAFMIFSEDGTSSYVYRLTDEETRPLGITEDMLNDAVELKGGALIVPGHYPINSAIRCKLAEML